MQTRPKRFRRGCGFSILGVMSLCLLLISFSALSNRNLPEETASENLSELDKARLAETLNLKARLGDRIWPDWGSTNIPVIIWNKGYEFLVDYPDQPPEGWAPVAEDAFYNQPYLRQVAVDPQNFAVPLGEGWAASMATKSTTDAFLISSFRNMFPAPIKQIFPYRLLIQPSETQIGGLLHETFHVLQMQMAPQRLEAAETVHRQGDAYQQAAGDFRTEWKSENQMLAKALQAESREEKLQYVRQFLTQRDERRKAHGLGPELVDYERWIEWEEGTGQYIELASLKTASKTADYKSLPAMQQDPDFKAYKTYNQRWAQEMIQLRYQTNSGEESLYVSGLAQAFLLDDLLPNWKEQYWREGVFLEDLLRQATARE